MTRSPLFRSHAWLALIILISFLLAFISILRRRRRLLELLGVHSGDKELRKRLSHDLLFWSLALQRLAKFGYSKQLNETPLAFSRRVAKASPEAAEALDTLVDQLYHVRFGGHELDRKARMDVLEVARTIPLQRITS